MFPSLRQRYRRCLYQLASLPYVIWRTPPVPDSVARERRITGHKPAAQRGQTPQAPSIALYPNDVGHIRQIAEARPQYPA